MSAKVAPAESPEAAPPALTPPPPRVVDSIGLVDSFHTASG